MHWGLFAFSTRRDSCILQNWQSTTALLCYFFLFPTRMGIFTMLKGFELLYQENPSVYTFRNGCWFFGPSQAPAGSWIWSSWCHPYDGCCVRRTCSQQREDVGRMSGGCREELELRSVGIPISRWFSVPAPGSRLGRARRGSSWPRL